jgi:Family of unknown function (DUF6069)
VAHVRQRRLRGPRGRRDDPVVRDPRGDGLLLARGIVLALALLRWSARPATRFVWTTVSLTAISLVPPFLAGANAATSTDLVGLHLVAAALMIPTLARSLCSRTD